MNRLLTTEAVTIGELKKAVECRLAKDQLQLIHISYAREHQVTGEVCWIRVAAENGFQEADVLNISDNENLYCAVQPSS